MRPKLMVVILNNKKRYRISIISSRGKLICFDEFKAKEIDFDKVYEIRCLDKSEKRKAGEKTTMRDLNIRFIDNQTGYPLVHSKVKAYKIYSFPEEGGRYFTKMIGIKYTDNSGMVSFYTNKTGKIQLKTNRGRCVK